MRLDTVGVEVVDYSYHQIIKIIIDVVVVIIYFVQNQETLVVAEIITP